MRARDFITETAQEEAWELVLQPVPEIQAFVKQMGLSNDEKSVAQIASRIDAIPDQQLPAVSIPRLKNLANKPGEGAILQALQRISGRPDAAEQYIQLIHKRDSAEGRQRDHVSGLVDQIRSGQYESPVLLKLPTGLYVIGGRTRLYAALALGVPAKVKIISGNTFVKQGVAEGPGTVDINSIASQLRFLPTTKQAKRYRFVANGQPGQMPAMSYTVSQQEQPVVTVTADGKETQNVAAVNDIIMSGPSGENYVVKAAKFPKLYQGQVGQTVIPEQSPRQVAQYQGRDTVTFTAPWGESMVLKPGDYLVRDGDQGYYRIAQAEYRQTYNPPGR